MKLGSGVKFEGLPNAGKAIEVGRNAGEYPELLRLSHPGGSTLGGYDIKLTGNTSYNELRLMGGSNADTSASRSWQMVGLTFLRTFISTPIKSRGWAQVRPTMTP